jgi:hypothetical protein
MVIWQPQQLDAILCLYKFTGTDAAKSYILDWLKVIPVQEHVVTPARNPSTINLQKMQSEMPTDLTAE